MALATVLVFITVSAAEVSMRLLMVASQMSGKRTYEELAAHCFGKAGKSTVDLSITVLNMGSLVAYLNILADMFSLVANTIIPPGAEPSRNMLLTGGGWEMISGGWRTVCRGCCCTRYCLIG